MCVSDSERESRAGSSFSDWVCWRVLRTVGLKIEAMTLVRVVMPPAALSCEGLFVLDEPSHVALFLGLLREALE
jgi:hypothetical protein